MREIRTSGSVGGPGKVTSLAYPLLSMILHYFLVRPTLVLALVAPDHSCGDQDEPSEPTC